MRHIHLKHNDEETLENISEAQAIVQYEKEKEDGTLKVRPIEKLWEELELSKDIK